jgi:hypothetical protein
VSHFLGLHLASIQYTRIAECLVHCTAANMARQGHGWIAGEESEFGAFLLPCGVRHWMLRDELQRDKVLEETIIRRGQIPLSIVQQL